MSKIVEAQVKCGKCGHVFDTHIWSTLNTHGPQKWLDSFFDKTLFDVECPNCKETIHLHYNMLYHDMEHHALVWYTPDNSEESISSLEEGLKAFRHLGDYQARIVFSQDHLVEKAKIFREALDDRIIEVMKAFAVVHCTGSIEGFEFVDAFFEVEGEEKYFVIISEDNAYNYTFSLDFYNEIKDVAFDLIEFASEDKRLIDFAWADELSYSVSDRLPSSNEEDQIEDPELCEFKCKNCGFEFENNGVNSVTNDDNPDLLTSFFDFSLFQTYCPECNGLAVLNDYFVYYDHDEKMIVLYMPADYSDRETFIELCLIELRKWEDYTIRLVDSLESLVEKAKIFRAGLDDRIIEFMKVEASQYELSVHTDAPEDFYRNSYFDGARKFAVFKFDDSLKNAITCPLERHDDLKKAFSNIFDKYSDGLLTIGYSWAKEVQAILTEETQKLSQKSFNSFTYDDIRWEESPVTYKEIWENRVPFQSPYKREDYIKNGKINWKRDMFTPEERLIMAIFDEDKQNYESYILKYYSQCMQKNDFSIFSKVDLDRARELVNEIENRID